MDEKIFELLESKDFSELSQTEQDLILQHMSPEDYTRSRLSILNGIQEFDNAINQTGYDNDLLEELHKHTGQKAGFIYFLKNTKISLLKIAAVFIVFLLGYTLFLVNMFNHKEQGLATTSIKTDTIYLTRTKTLKTTDTVFITRIKEIAADNHRETQSTAVNNTQKINSEDIPNLKKIYAKEALYSIKRSKNSTSTGLNLNIEDHPIVLNSAISDQTCVSIDALCNM